MSDALDALIHELRRQIDELNERIARLEDQLADARAGAVRWGPRKEEP